MERDAVESDAAPDNDRTEAGGPIKPSPAPELAGRYHEIMAFRRETLVRYKANEMSVFAGPRPQLTFPSVAFGKGPAKKRVGPFRFEDRSPIMRQVEAILIAATRPLTILEIGPGRGEFAAGLLARHGHRIARYYAFDRDPTTSGLYTRLDSLRAVPAGIDLVIASEVIEHMTADELYVDVLLQIAPKLNSDAAFVLSTPNPLAPGGIARDFTHRQGYPWYDLYAIFRLEFGEVDIWRSFYLFDAKRLVGLLPRVILCSLLELEWCDGLICVARRPRRAGEVVRE